MNYKNTVMLELSHKNLQVYQVALKLVKEVYQHTQSYPREEQFVLVTQLRRAIVSVCSNLTEGAARFFEIAEEKIS